MKSLYFRQFLLTAALIIISFLVMGAVVGSLTYNFFTNERRETLIGHAAVVSDTASAFEVGGGSLWVDNSYFRLTLSTTARATETNIFVCRTSGEIAICSEEEIYCEHAGLYVPGEALLEIDSTGSYSEDGSLGGIFGSRRLVAGVPIKNSYDATVGYVFISGERSVATSVWKSTVSIFIFAAFCALLLALLVSVYTTRRQTRPLNAMADAARRFARGDFSTRVHNDGRKDEIGDLTRAFNAMAESLERSETLRREFVANVSHELKTPVTTISGYVDGILDGTIPPERQESYLEVISAETQRMTRLIRRMLEVSQLQTMGPDRALMGSFDLNELICQVVISLEGRITGRGLDIAMELPDGPVVVRGDRDGINQVVYNLLDNAIKFAAPETALGLGLTVRSGRARVVVRNLGATIPPEELPLIFDRFHKTDHSRSLDREGVGLGLHIVTTMLNLHGERIYVTSENGVTEFTFGLNLA